MEEVTQLSHTAKEVILGTDDAAGNHEPRRPPPPRLVLRDGVHLLDPGAHHHSVLAALGLDVPAAADGPAMDVVFVHGIRGGPFATWRVDARGNALSSGEHDGLPIERCWPTQWLAGDLQGARLLSVEYSAPASGWEGEGLPLRDTVSVLLAKLQDAGVGRRPVVFVCHRCVWVEGGTLRMRWLWLVADAT